MKKAEIKYYGQHACLGLFEKRPEDIIRVYVHKDKVDIFGKILQWCAQNKKAYHLLDGPDLAAVAESVHHEGVVLLALAPQSLENRTFLAAVKKNNYPALLYLDGVQNPHNIGSILRAMAHFGCRYLLGEKGSFPKVSPSMARVSQGGIEHVSLVRLNKPLDLLRELHINQQYQVFATSSHAKSSLYKAELKQRSLFILGNETTGISKPLMKLAKEHINITGTGNVESLNVASSASLLLSEYWRQHASKV